MLLGVNVGQIDDLVVTLNSVLPKGIRLRFEVEHKLVPPSVHRTLGEAMREQRIEEEFAAECDARDHEIERRLTATFKGAA